MDDCGTSARSVTTRGGADFDDLVTGRAEPHYTFRLTRIRSNHAAMQRDPKNTRTNAKGNQDYNALHRATDTLVKWVDDTITDIEIQSEKKVVKFYIGKTYVRKNKNSKVFDAMNPNTWKKDGIRSRWCHHKHQDYGKNGMVVLTVVTKDDVPQQSIEAFKHQEMYALALEQQLIIHYAFIRGDERLANTSTHPGMQQQEESRAIGYPIYMTFASDDSGIDLSVEADGKKPYVVMDEAGSSAEEETTEKLQNVGLTEKQEEAIHGALGKPQVLPFEKESQERLQPAHNSGNSKKRHIHFSKEETICGIDPDPWVSPEPPMSNSDDKTDPFTQPQDENLLTQNERNPAEADTIYHLSSERKGPFTENTPHQKEQRSTNSSSSSKSRHQLKMFNPQHPESVLAEPGECKEMPIVIDGEH